MTDCKAKLEGGRHGGAAGLYRTVVDRTRGVREVYPSRQDIYVINVCMCVSVCVTGSEVT